MRPTNSLVTACFIALMVVCVPALSMAEDDARLGAGDELLVLVPEGSDLREYKVVIDSSGEVALGVYGRVSVAGSTLEEGKASIRTSLATMLASTAGVHVVLLERGAMVLVSGHVEKPGVVRVSRGSHAWSAIQRAGGPMKGANLEGVEIVRDGAKLPLDLHAYLTTGATSPEDHVAPGDTIFVPADATLAPVHNAAQALMSDRALGGKVVVIGAVVTPGVFTHSQGLTFVHALAMAGGPRPEADLAFSRIIDATSSRRLDLTGQLGGSSAPVVIPTTDSGVIVYVPAFHDEQPMTHRPVAHVMGEVTEAGEVALDGGDTPLTTVLSRAGGPSEKADLKRVRVVHRQSGLTMASTYDMQRYARQGGAAALATVRPGDTVFVEGADRTTVKQVTRTISDIAIIAATFTLLLAL